MRAKVRERLAPFLAYYQQRIDQMIIETNTGSYEDRVREAAWLLVQQGYWLKDVTVAEFGRDWEDPTDYRRATSAITAAASKYDVGYPDVLKAFDVLSAINIAPTTKDVFWLEAS
jgi:hypothetical protein